MRTSLWIIVAVAGLPLVGCRQEVADSMEQEAPLEVEDVAPAVDAGLSTDADIKGPPIVSGVSGVLPSDYPRDLPTHEPASIVDFGGTASGWSFVELDTPSRRPLVSASLSDRLTRAGWSINGEGDTALTASKGAVRVRISFVDLEPGTRIRVEYR